MFQNYQGDIFVSVTGPIRIVVLIRVVVTSGLFRPFR